MDIADAYPQDDSELDKLHPDTPIAEQTEEWARQVAYEDLTRALLRSPADRLRYELGCALIGYDGPQVAGLITRYAEAYGWRSAIHAVYGVLPS